MLEIGPSYILLHILNIVLLTAFAAGVIVVAVLLIRWLRRRIRA